MTAEKHTNVSKLERGLADEIEAVINGMRSRSKISDTIADALAAHRARCTGFARALIEPLAVPHEGMSLQTLTNMQRGWTPSEVHRLIAAHRRLLIALDEAPRLLGDALAGERSVRTTE